MSKVIIFSHDSDIDGMGSVVLAKLAFDELDYVLLPDVEALEITFRKYIELDSLDEYEKIFVTDLSLYDPALTIVAESDLKDKTLVFDHHQRSIESGMNRYPFTKVIEKDEKGKRCGTQLFYEYLCENNLLKRTEALDTFVEYTRLEDAWEWKQVENGYLAHDLSVLFNIIGIEEYLKQMTKKLKENTVFEYSIEERRLIDDKKQRLKTELDEIMSKAVYLQDENHNNFVVINSPYEFRNEFPEYILESGNPNNIKYILIVALDKGENGQKSYRCVEQGFNVNNIAMKYGGGGHPGAAAVGITKEQRDTFDSLPLREGLVYLSTASFN